MARMPNRAADWFRRAERDLAQAEDSRRAGRHERACFAAQQAAEKAVRALHLRLGQEAWGHVVAVLIQDLPETVHPRDDLIEKGRVLDNFYIPPGTPTATHRGRRSSTTDRSTARRQCAMPVRSLSSSVFKGPDARTVDAAARDWAGRAARQRGDVVRSATSDPTRGAIGAWEAIWT